MKIPGGRRILAAALSVVAATSGVIVAAPAHAQQVTTGTLKFSGDKGEYISQGRSWSYDTAKGDALDVFPQVNGGIRIKVDAYNGDDWSIEFAPGAGVLAPGTYPATHGVGPGTGPVLELFGEARGCEATGSFTVTKVVVAGADSVQAFDATFEQHCQNLAPVLRGEVHISNPAPPAAATRTATSSSATPGSAASTPAGHSGNAVANGSSPSPVTPMDVAVHAQRGMIGAAVTFWAVTAVAGLLTVGIALIVRSRRIRQEAVLARRDA